MKSLRGLLIILFLVALSACAKQSSPSGGPKDEDPPIVVKSLPESGTVNFREKSFEITFNEYFVLASIDQKLLISPPLSVKPLIKTKNKTLMVSFEEELRDSVTYTFYFQDAIRDLNESNPIENFQYVFSTGSYLDSLSVTGTINNAENLEPGEEIFILLYQGESDTLPRTTIPAYITRAAADGRFRIDNIAGGRYSIYGLKDANNNKKYDMADEAFAFSDSLILLEPENNFIPKMPDTLKTAADSAAYLRIPGKEYALYFFTATPKLQYLKGTDREPGYRLRFNFAMPVDSGKFEIGFPEQPDTPFFIEPSAGRDTFLVWLTDSLFYKQQLISARLVYPATDSTGQISPFVDTIDMRYIEPRPVRGATRINTNKLKVVTNASSRKGLSPVEKVRFSFETPVEKPDTSRITLYQLKDTLLIKKDYTLARDTMYNNRFVLDGKFVVDSSYLLITDRGAFSDIYSHENDSVSYRFKIRNSESFGSLGVILSGYRGDIILQLLSNDEKIIESRKFALTGTRTERYPYLEPADYRLKVIYDLDGDGKWTTGDFDAGRQAEPVAYYPQVLNIKVLWTVEQEWELKGLREKGDDLKKSSRVPAGRGAASSRNR